MSRVFVWVCIVKWSAIFWHVPCPFGIPLRPSSSQSHVITISVYSSRFYRPPYPLIQRPLDAPFEFESSFKGSNGLNICLRNHSAFRGIASWTPTRIWPSHQAQTGTRGATARQSRGARVPKRRMETPLFHRAPEAQRQTRAHRRRPISTQAPAGRGLSFGRKCSHGGMTGTCQTRRRKKKPFSNLSSRVDSSPSGFVGSFMARVLHDVQRPVFVCFCFCSPWEALWCDDEHA